MIALVVNGQERTVGGSPTRTLLEVLREDFRLTGAKYGCGEGKCGACTVLVDGSPRCSCTVCVDELGGAHVTTVEALATGGRLHPVQAAFVDARALQCGYCTSGMVMRACALLADDAQPTDDAIVRALDGNICRCGGYPRIVDAVPAAATGPASSLSETPPDALATDGEDPVVEPAWTFAVTPARGDGPGSWGWSTPGGARLRVDAAGRVHAYVGKVDGGQGNRWSLVRLIAAGLDTPAAAVTLTMGDTALCPEDLGTFGSRSTADAGHGVRLVAAAAKRELLAAAATRWGLEIGGVSTDCGRVVDRAGGRTVTYGSLVAAGPRTVDVDPGEPVAPLGPALATVGDDAVRLGLAAAVTGAKRFPSDISLPGMLHGRVLRPPASGAPLLSVDATAARTVAGVVVVDGTDFVAVAAPTTESADDALGRVDVRWGSGSGPGESALEAHLRDHPLDQPGWGGTVAHETGDVDGACATADVMLAHTYTTAYLAHVPLEPRVAVAAVDGQKVTVWVGTQRPFAVRSEVASALDLDEADVHVIVPDFGAGFGGKHTGEVAVEAARLARAAGRPVRVAWTREEEFRYAYFRPAAVIDIRSAARADGTLTAWEFTNINSGPAGLFSPYRAANERVRYQPAASPLRQGSYRALAATANNFARESHIDEIAAATGADPVELRLRHLGDDRLRRVLTTVAERAGWPGSANDVRLGIACGIEKDARVATAAHVRAEAGGFVVERLTTAIDCGAVVDPDGLHAQVVGATIMGLGGALFEAVHFDAGRIRNASLADYRVPRFSDVPPIDVTLLDQRGIEPAGAGETPIIAVAPAIANAIAATGRRIRSLPLHPSTG